LAALSQRCAIGGDLIADCVLPTISCSRLRESRVENFSTRPHDLDGASSVAPVPVGAHAVPDTVALDLLGWCPDRCRGAEGDVMIEVEATHIVVLHEAALDRVPVAGGRE
jgi:hypothetical protein